MVPKKLYLFLEWLEWLRIALGKIIKVSDFDRLSFGYHGRQYTWVHILTIAL